MDRAIDEVLKQLRGAVAEAETLLESGGERLGEARGALMENLDQARDRLAALERELVLRTRIGALEADRYAREHPWRVAGIGLALGVALAAATFVLLDRRSD